MAVAIALKTAKVKLLGRYLWPDRLEGVIGKVLKSDRSVRLERGE